MGGGTGTAFAGGAAGALALLPTSSGGGRLSRDLSEVWGLHTSTEGETFDLEGVNPDDPIPWDLDEMEVERLRAASQGGGGEGLGGLEGLTPASDARTRKEARGEWFFLGGGGWLGAFSKEGGLGGKGSTHSLDQTNGSAHQLNTTQQLMTPQNK